MPELVAGQKGGSQETPSREKGKEYQIGPDLTTPSLLLTLNNKKAKA
jgi:hypothetical protein